MIKVSEKAGTMIKNFLEEQKDPHTVRILLQTGCCGSGLSMALDKPQENDLTFTEQGVTFVVDKDLLDQAKIIFVDFVESENGSGFRLVSSLSTGGGCCG